MAIEKSNVKYVTCKEGNTKSTGNMYGICLNNMHVLSTQDEKDITMLMYFLSYIPYAIKDEDYKSIHHEYEVFNQMYDKNAIMPNYSKEQIKDIICRFITNSIMILSKNLEEQLANQQQPVLQESVPANMSVDIDNILNRFIKPMQQQPVQQQPVMTPNQILIDWNNINQQTLDMVTTELKKYVDFNKNNLNQDKITIDVIRSLYTAIIIYGQQLTSRLQTYGMFSYTFMIQEYMPNAIKLKTPNIPNTNNYLEIIIDNNGFVTSCLVKTN